MYKKVCTSLPPEYYYELQWIKKYLGCERMKDAEFLRWLIHKLYNRLQSKYINEMGV
mgnify:CR=1 FL=1